MFSRSIRSARALPKFVRFTSSEVICEEIRIPVPWGYIAGKWWGPTDQRPVLTLHGWQDNCGSFNRLLPLMDQNMSFLAIDFPGHGLSSRIPSGLYCLYMDYIILVQYLKNYFQWPKVSLMGHSMGGITSFVYTMLYPNNVDFLICIDGAKPMIAPNNVGRMSNLISKWSQYSKFEQDSGKEPPSYEIEEIKQKIVAPNCNSVYYEFSHHLAERNIAPSKIHPNKYYFTRDPRLKAGGLMNWPQEDTIKDAKHMTCPIFIVKSNQGSYYEVKENFHEVIDVLKEASADLQFHKLEGTHHLHLNNPEELAILLRAFMAKHNVEDRTVGGLKEDMRSALSC